MSVREFEVYNTKFKEVQAYVYLNVEDETWKVRLLDSYVNMTPDILFEVWHNSHPDELWFDERTAHNYIHMRVIPPDRQALSEYLGNMGLKEYNVVKLIEYSSGRCDMDFSMFREIPYDGVMNDNINWAE